MDYNSPKPSSDSGVSEAMDTGAGATGDTKKDTNTKPSGATSTGLKDFSLNSDSLLIQVSDEDLPAPDPATSDDFVVVEPISKFVEAAIKDSERTRTQNLGPTFSTSGDPRVDFFFHVMEQSSNEQTISLLKDSWNHNSLDTLKLIGSLRDIKDGKGIRQQYHITLYWLYQHHPRTLYKNLPKLLEYGYWKDALQILMVALFDGFVHPFLSHDDGVKKSDPIPTPKKRLSRKRKSGIRKSKQTDTEKRLYNSIIASYYKIDQEVSKIPGKEMNNLRLRYAREKFQKSIKYRTFHVRVAKVFAEQLSKDIRLFQSKTKTDLGNISLCSKWAPTLEGHFDRYTLIGSTIALELSKLFEKDFLTKSIPVAVYLSRKFYNKEVCIPLRNHLEIPEKLMSSGEWNKINYKRVASKCMQKNKTLFLKHDKDRLEAYLKKDDSKVAGATLKPIELIRSAMGLTSSTDELEKTIIEKQWISLVEDIKAKGSALLTNAVSICDVSGSMSGDPILAALGLTLLTMDMTAEPWNKICITFSEEPQIHTLDPKFSLIEKLESLRLMDWGGTTNFQKSLEKVLEIGLKNQLSADEMPKLLLVFTDMEFNEAFPETTMTNFEHGKEQFEKNGYKLPTMVFWNLRSNPNGKSTPVQVNEYGVLLLSGFSGQILKFVLGQKDLANCTPWSFVRDLIGQEKYNGLEIFD